MFQPFFQFNSVAGRPRGRCRSLLKNLVVMKNNNFVDISPFFDRNLASPENLLFSFLKFESFSFCFWKCFFEAPVVFTKRNRRSFHGNPRGNLAVGGHDNVGSLTAFQF
jgi:hypothetical protein